MINLKIASHHFREIIRLANIILFPYIFTMLPKVIDTYICINNSFINSTI